MHWYKCASISKNLPEKRPLWRSSQEDLTTAWLATRYFSTHSLNIISKKWGKTPTLTSFNAISQHVTFTVHSYFAFLLMLGCQPSHSSIQFSRIRHGWWGRVFSFHLPWHDLMPGYQVSSSQNTPEQWDLCWRAQAPDWQCFGSRIRAKEWCWAALCTSKPKILVQKHSCYIMQEGYQEIYF